MNIVYQDNNFVFAQKKSLCLTVPPRIKDDRSVLGLMLQEYFNRQIFPIHRLDYEVSGLVMFALNKDAHRKAQSWFENKKVQKKYEALSKEQDFSHWPKEILNPREKIDTKENNCFHWESKITRGKKRSYFHPQGEWASTIVNIVDKRNETLLWELSPITGKPHQLRLEMSFHGFPILGDTLYGAKEKWEREGIALNSYRLDFSMISSDERMNLPETIEIERIFK